MHNNYYFLRQLAPVLDKKLVGKYLIEAFSQEKDELILVLDDHTGDDFLDPFFIRMSMRPEFACLFFPDRFERARKNSVNLFPDAVGKRVKKVFVFENERALGFAFENDCTFVFKPFGNRSNGLLFDRNGHIKDIFQRRLKSDYDLLLDQLSRPIRQDYEAFEQAGFQWEPLFPTFGKIVKKYLKEQLEGITEPGTIWAQVEDVLHQLNAGEFYLSVQDYELCLSLIRLEASDKKLTDPIEALNAFYTGISRVSYLEKEKAEAIRFIRKTMDKTQNYLSHSYNRLELLLNGSRNEEIGNIIMANLHQIQEHATEATLFDFYRDQEIVIKLKKGVTPQKVAESYYRKGKNEQIEISTLEQNIVRREEELKACAAHQEAVEKMERVKDLRDYLRQNGLSGQSKTPDPIDLFTTFEINGFTVLVGKNAKNNDLLTKQYARKDDLWLHARDVSGSHVVIRHQAGKKIPAGVIEKAAEMAAWYSKRRTDSLCPVIVTPKKYVRKAKGLPEGSVLIEREEVIMVKPSPPARQTDITAQEG